LRDAGFDLKAVGLKFLLEESGTLRFMKTELGGFPDLAGDLPEALGMGGDVREHGVGVGGGEKSGGCDQENYFHVDLKRAVS
jgi:hypothetical protein